MYIKFPSLVSELSKPLQTLLKTKQLHALIATYGLLCDPFYATKLVRFYALNNDIPSARNLFDETPQRSVFLWNAIIRAHAQSHRFNDAFSLYKKMVETEIRPDHFTYACLVHASHESSDLNALRVVHSGAIVSGYGLDSVCCSALVTAYSKLGLMVEASKVFCGIFEPDLVLWNALISGCAHSGLWSKGLQLFNEMIRDERHQPDGYSFAGLISGLQDSDLLGSGLAIHGLCFKSGFEDDAHLGSAFVSMYSRFKYMDSAYRVFTGLSNPDLVTWSALITGYSQSSNHEKALLLFSNLMAKGEKGDPVLVACVLNAAAQSGSVLPGSVIHSFLLRQGLEMDVMVSSALIDMYFKCGPVASGMCVFQNLSVRNIVSYNAVISGLGVHGFVSEAFLIFENILQKGLTPDQSTFSGLLCACCHRGLVSEGRNIFRQMRNEFGIQPRTEHYVYVVKLLSMAGELEEAYNFIMSLTKPVDSSIWGALLSCCATHGNSKLAEDVAQQLFSNERDQARYVVMLSNVYAGDGRWDSATRTRDRITDGNYKLPGCSWASSNFSY